MKIMLTMETEKTVMEEKTAPVSQKQDTTSYTNDNEVNKLLKSYISRNERHSVLQVTYGEVFEKVYARIMKHKEKDELLRILKQEIIAGRGKCFTGRLSRLVSVLCGYYDDIHINIGTADQIKAKVDVAKTVALRKNPDDYITGWYNLAIKYLKEIDVEDEDIEKWVKPIKDMMEPETENAAE